MTAKMYTKTCVYCGKEFETRREDAKYCSHLCFEKHSEVGRFSPKEKTYTSIENELAEIKSMLQQILDKMEKPEPPEV